MAQSIKHQWWKWHTANPHVWELFVKFTFQAIQRGHKNYSSKAVFERIRWHTDVETVGEPFKMSNNYTAYYARLFHHKYPQYDGFFRTKMLRSSIVEEGE